MSAFSDENVNSDDSGFKFKNERICKAIGPDNFLFVSPGNVVEICGHSGSGKSFLVDEMIAEILAAGFQCTIVDTDLKLCCARIERFLIDKKCDLNSCWENLNIVSCERQSDAIGALYRLTEPPKAPLRFVFIDSVSAYFWENRAVHKLRHTSFLAAIKTLCEPRLRTVFVCTKQLFFDDSTDTNACVGPGWSDLVTHSFRVNDDRTLSKIF